MMRLDQPDQRAESEVSAQALHPDWKAEDHLIRLLVDNARDHGDQIAMRERDYGVWKCYTWRDYLERVLSLAAGLDALGLGPRDNVLVIGDNRPELYFGMVALISLRAVPSPAYPDATPTELADQIRREDIRYALAEDQEQVDKLCGIRARHGGLETILYDDPRGLAGQEAEGVIALQEIARRGAERLAAQPSLREDLLSRPTAHDVAVLLHSSGTTGTPKGVPLKHGHLLASVRNAARAGYFREAEVHMAYLPMAWVGDFIFSVCAAMALRFSVNVPEKQETALHDLREIGPTLYFSSPRAWSNMLTRIQVGIDDTSKFKRALYNHFMPFAMEVERRRLRGIEPSVWQRFWRGVGEALIYGPIKDQLGLARVARPYTAGEAIGEDVFLFFRALGLDLKQFYGQTENCALAAAQPSGEVTLHTVGRPFPGVEIRIDDSGEILVRGDNVFDGYYQNPQATAEALKGGWLHTGDAGYFEDHGHIVVLGRVSEVVYTAAGERFVPTYIENRLKFSHYIKDVCVLGKDRDYLTAMVAVDFDAVGHWAEEHGVGYTSFADLAQKPQVCELIGGLLEHTNGLLPRPLRIQRFVNLHKAFDPDDGEVTRTRKLRRNVIDEHYRPIIDALYQGLREVEFDARIAYETGETGVLRRRLVVHDLAVDQED